MSYQPSPNRPSAETVAGRIEAALGALARRVASLPDELTYEVEPVHLIEVATRLRDAAELRFEQLMDVAGIDYLGFGSDEWKTLAATGSGFSRGVQRGDAPRLPVNGRRFAVVYHLLSLAHNCRVRLRVPCEDAEDPIVDSMVPVWPSANWFEREAFDLFGITFDGHPDMTRILMPENWQGHPLRKDYAMGRIPVQFKGAPSS